jgi:hypothetical protein
MMGYVLGEYMHYAKVREEGIQKGKSKVGTVDFL